MTSINRDPFARQETDMLTAYELSCGSVQKHSLRTTDGKHIDTTLWKEHGVYHVRTHNFRTSTRLVWRTYKTLRDARREYGMQIRHVRQGIMY